MRSMGSVTMVIGKDGSWKPYPQGDGGPRSVRPTATQGVTYRGFDRRRPAQSRAGLRDFPLVEHGAAADAVAGAAGDVITVTAAALALTAMLRLRPGPACPRRGAIRLDAGDPRRRPQRAAQLAREPVTFGAML